MTEQQMIDRAMAICVEAHSGQMDRYGQIYIFHPMRVMQRVNSINDKCVAILHDVVEDSEWTVEDLTQEGFPSVIVDAVDAISKRDDEEYTDYIQRVRENAIAIRVKLADLEDNMDLRRTRGEMTVSDLERLKRYRKAYTVLNESVGIDPYFN